jgi:hypothetical protein
MCVALGGCHKKEDARSGGERARPTEPSAPAAAAAVKPSPAAALAVPELGVDQVRRFSYPYGEGAAAFAKAVTAYKAKPRDWEGVRTGSEAALAKDPYHLDAHRLLAAALAQSGTFGDAATHVIAAMAADWQKQGPSALADPDLAGLMASPVGEQLETTAVTLKNKFIVKAGAGVLMVARRSAFKLPDKPGPQYASPRGELYAYDRETKRFLRLSQTDHTVGGFLASPSGKELVLIGYDQIEQIADDTGAAINKNEPPLISRPFVLMLDAATFEPIGKRVTLPKGHAVAVAYGNADRLLAVVMARRGWYERDANDQWFTIDISTGTKTKTEMASTFGAVSITADSGSFISSEAGAILAAHDSDKLDKIATAAGAEIEAPDSKPVNATTVLTSPDKASVAFATSVDPCNQGDAPSLYVASTEGKGLMHVLTGRSRFVARWVDNHTLVYEDPESAVRFYDLVAGRETLRLGDKGGLGLAFLSVSAAPPCNE